jgi:hypothetical protein
MHVLLTTIKDAVTTLTGKKPATKDRDPRGAKLHARIIQAAQEHGWNTDPDNEVQDLQRILKHALGIMSQGDRDKLEKRIGEKVYDEYLDDEWHIHLREEHRK